MRQDNFEVIFETLSGSRLYGTSHAGSDTDYRGVCVTSVEHMLNPFEKFEQQVETKLSDRTIYHVKKFVSLCADNNPNIIELLSANSSSIVRIDRRGEYLLENRGIFLSQKIRVKFMGYAFAQLKRIETHKGYLLNPPNGKPERKDFGLEASPRFGTEKMNAILHSPKEAILEEYRDYVVKEQQYRASYDNYRRYMHWMKNRNPVRFEIEKKFGYDLKHANHLFRLLFEGQELLETGNLVFPLAQAEFLKRILAGEFSYEKLMLMFEERKSEFDAVESKLPMKPNQSEILKVYENIIYNKV